MKKLLFILLTILITFPLFGQELSLTKNNRNKQIENFFNTDTVKKIDTVYIVIEYDYGNHDYIPYFNRYFRGFYIDYRYSFNYYYYNWYCNDFYWSYTHNWHYDNYLSHYSNYHHNYTYRPRPPKPIRQRTIATTTRKPVVRPERTREYVRPVSTTTNSRYNRPASTYNGNVNNVRQSNTHNRPTNTYNRPTTTSKPTSTYNRPSSQRRYNSTTVRSYNGSSSTKSGTTNRGSSTKSGTSNSSSGRGRK